MPTESMDEYIEAIYRLGGAGVMVPVGNLAQHLDISVVSTNEMIKRLAGQGLLEYEPYRGIRLTDSGTELALHILRCHRLWERFLTDTLGLPWDLVHAEACRLEHITSPLVEERLSAFLGDPACCPHGSPVPGAAGSPNADHSIPLAALQAGQEATVTRVPDEDRDLLLYIDELGLRPGSHVKIVSVAPFGGPMTLEVAGKRETVGGRVTLSVMVRPLD